MVEDTRNTLQYDPNEIQPWYSAGDVGNVLWNKYIRPGLPSDYDPDRENWVQKLGAYMGIPGRLAFQPWRDAPSAPDWTHLPENELTGAFNTALGMMGLGAKFGGEGIGAFPGWHGSRHKFDPLPHAPYGEFKHAAINTGEGTQWEGHGFYVGSQRGVGEFYKTAGAGFTEPDAQFQGKNWDDVSFSHPVEANTAMYSYKLFNGDVDLAREHMQQIVDTNKEELKAFVNSSTGKPLPGFEYFAKNAQERIDDYTPALKWLDDNAHHLSYTDPSKGHLYQVWVHPEHHEFLQWDKSLADQTEGVRAKLHPLLDTDWHHLQNYTGKQVYNYIARDMGDPVWASEALDKAGIPGTKYKDGFSRSLPSQAHYEGLKYDQSPDVPEMVKKHIDSMMRNAAYAGNTHYFLRDLHDRLLQTERLAGDPLSNYTGRFGPHEQTLKDLDWMNQNSNGFTLEDHPDTTHNFVLFHPRHASIIDRDGTVYGLHPVEHDPFTGERADYFKPPKKGTAD